VDCNIITKSKLIVVHEAPPSSFQSPLSDLIKVAEEQQRDKREDCLNKNSSMATANVLVLTKERQKKNFNKVPFGTLTNIPSS